MGCEGQEKRWLVVWAAVPQDGQRSVGDLPTAAWQLLRAESTVLLSVLENVVPYGRGRDCSSAETEGGLALRTVLGGSCAMARRTESVWIILMVDL